MVLVPNVGSDRVLDRLRRGLRPAGTLGVATDQFPLFAFEALSSELEALGRCRLALAPNAEYTLNGAAADHPSRNQLRQPCLARRCAAWLRQCAEPRVTSVARINLCPQRLQSEFAAAVTAAVNDAPCR